MTKIIDCNTKKVYKKPQIEFVLLDNAVALVMGSGETAPAPGGAPGGDGGTPWG